MLPTLHRQIGFRSMRPRHLGAHHQRGGRPLRGALLLVLVLLMGTGGGKPEAEDLAFRADRAHEDLCSVLQVDDAVARGQARAEVEGLRAELDAALKASAALVPHLLYWRGLLAECLDLPEEAITDLRAFVSGLDFLGAVDRDRQTALTAMLQDTQRRLRRLERSQLRRKLSLHPPRPKATMGGPDRRGPVPASSDRAVQAEVETPSVGARSEAEGRSQSEEDEAVGVVPAVPVAQEVTEVTEGAASLAAEPQEVPESAISETTPDEARGTTAQPGQDAPESGRRQALQDRRFARQARRAVEWLDRLHPADGFTARMGASFRPEHEDLDLRATIGMGAAKDGGFAVAIEVAVFGLDLDHVAGAVSEKHVGRRLDAEALCSDPYRGELPGAGDEAACRSAMTVATVRAGMLTVAAGPTWKTHVGWFTLQPRLGGQLSWVVLRAPMQFDDEEGEQPGIPVRNASGFRFVPGLLVAGDGFAARPTGKAHFWWRIGGELEIRAPLLADPGEAGRVRDTWFDADGVLGVGFLGEGGKVMLELRPGATVLTYPGTTQATARIGFRLIVGSS